MSKSKEQIKDSWMNKKKAYLGLGGNLWSNKNYSSLKQKIIEWRTWVKKGKKPLDSWLNLVNIPQLLTDPSTPKLYARPVSQARAMFVYNFQSWSFIFRIFLECSKPCLHLVSILIHWKFPVILSIHQNILLVLRKRI